MRRRSASGLSLYCASLLPWRIVVLHFTAPVRCSKLATFRRNNKKLRSVRRLLKLRKSFNGNYRRKKRGV